MISLLIGIICALTLIQTNKNRFNLALFYSLACVTHMWIFESAIGVDYYLSAGIFDFALIYGFCLYARPTEFSDKMILICFISLLFNFYGWFIYELYLSPVTYNIAFQSLYAYAILTLLKRDKADESYFPYWLHRICGAYHKCRGVFSPLHKEAQP